MQLVHSEARAERLIILEQTGSTNTDLVALAARERLAEFTVMVTSSQTNGRGRLGRVWVAPPGKSLAISVLLRPETAAGEPLGLEHFGWLPLLAGLAMTEAVTNLLPDRSVTLKWPNDVLVGGQKISGLLAELLPDGPAVVMGAGLNLALTAEELPTTTSTSLLIEGAALTGDALADAALAGYLDALRRRYTGFLRDGAGAGAGAGAAAASAELRAELALVCSTLGQEVRVHLPSGDDLVGIATDIDDSGRLMVATDGAVVAVAAGDVTHLRYE